MRLVVNLLNGFLCIGFVTSMEPLETGLKDSDWMQGIQRFVDTDPYQKKPLPELFQPSTDPKHLGKSSQPTNSIDVITTGELKELLQEVEINIMSYVPTKCPTPHWKLRVQAQRYPGTEFKFKSLLSGAEIEHVDVYVFEQDNKRVVRVKNARLQGDHVCNTNELRCSFRAVFETFYKHMHKSLDHLDDSGYFRMQKKAANWLWGVLTNHGDSLPVIGPINPGTEIKDYKFGPNQLALIELISKYSKKEDMEDQLHQIAENLAQLFHRLAPRVRPHWQSIEESPKRRKLVE